MSFIRRLKWKNESGAETEYDLGAKASNVVQDATHRFVTDTEKTTWNGKLGSSSDLKSNKVTFSAAASRANIKSGETLATIMGKIYKVIADIAAVAFSGSYADLTNKPTIPSGAAASCAVANNDTTTAAGSVADARIVRTHGLEIDTLRSDLAAKNFLRDRGNDNNVSFNWTGSDLEMYVDSTKVFGTKSFQDGVDTIYSGCTTYGSTPSARTPAAIVAAIKAIYTNRYNAGVTAADNRTNTSSANYKAGYNAGVAAARPFTIKNWSVWGTAAGVEYYVDVTNYSKMVLSGISATDNNDRFSGPGEGDGNISGTVHYILSEGLTSKTYDLSSMSGVIQVFRASVPGKITISQITFS